MKPGKNKHFKPGLKYI